MTLRTERRGGMTLILQNGGAGVDGLPTARAGRGQAPLPPRAAGPARAAFFCCLVEVLAGSAPPEAVAGLLTAQSPPVAHAVLRAALPEALAVLVLRAGMPASLRPWIFGSIAAWPAPTQSGRAGAVADYATARLLQML